MPHRRHLRKRAEHLLREASIDRAVAAYPDPDVIVGRNLRTLERLGPDGWRRVFAD